jgi:glutathione S-transferase
MTDSHPSLKLYITQNSPYARLARIIVSEKGLTDKVEQIVAQTRSIDSPYYEINPSGRVPCLILPDGTRLEESQLVCSYLDNLDNAPRFEPPPGDNGFHVRRLEAMARSLADGVSVWIREGFRPQQERSPGVITHERNRAARLIEVWETEVTHPMMGGKLSNMAQMTLLVALHLERWNPDFKWRENHPNLVNWAESLADRPSIQETMPVG